MQNKNKIVIYVIIYGGFTGRYMYPFLQVPSIGYWGVLVRVLILSVLYIVMGVIFVKGSNMIDKVKNLCLNDKNKIKQTV